MFPLRDINPRSSKPVVTIALVVANALAFLYELSLGSAGQQQLFFALGVIPARARLLTISPTVDFGDVFLPFLSSMFLHGGFWHILGNMWFLWVFGDNIEDRMGHGRFLVFYLLSGLVAGLAHTFMNLDSAVPAIGASGAVSGVMGAYLVLFPTSRVVTLVTLGWFLTTINLPAYAIILYWFVVQLVMGGAAAVGPRAGGGVAWWAHIGGFLAGMALVFLFRRQQRRRVEVEEL